jgi:hypothetical protein
MPRLLRLVGEHQQFVILFFRNLSKAYFIQILFVFGWVLKLHRLSNVLLLWQWPLIKYTFNHWGRVIMLCSYHACSVTGERLMHLTGQYMLILLPQTPRRWVISIWYRDIATLFQLLPISSLKRTGLKLLLLLLILGVAEIVPLLAHYVVSFLLFPVWRVIV